MATVNTKSFTDPAILKKFSPERLLFFCRRFEKEFENSGLNISEGHGDSIDYDAMVRFFADTESRSEKLIVALQTISEAANPEMIEVLREKCIREGIELDEEASEADVVLQVWLDAPYLVDMALCSNKVHKFKTLMSFFPSEDVISSDVKDFTPDMVPDLEKELSRRFEWEKYGPFSHIFYVPKKGIHWFLVQRGDLVKSEGKIQHDGRGRTVYRPEVYDVIAYTPQNGELRMKSLKRKRDIRLYKEVFGRMLSGYPDFFCREGKYCLNVLKNCGYDDDEALSCGDIPGLRKVVLTEVKMVDGVNGTLTKTAPDVLKDDTIIPLNFSEREFLHAKFDIYLEGAHKPNKRTLTIKPPNTLQWSSEPTLAIVEDWVGKRQFLLNGNAE